MDPSLRGREELLLDLLNLRIKTAGFTPVRLDASSPWGKETKLPFRAGFILTSEHSALPWVAAGWALAMGVPVCILGGADEHTAGHVSQEPNRMLPLSALTSKAEWRDLDDAIDLFLSRLPVVTDAVGETVAPAPVTAAIEDKPFPVSAEPERRSTPLAPETRSPVQAFSPSTEIPCAPHELRTLSIIGKGDAERGVSLKALGQALHQHGLAATASLAVNSLRRRGYIALKLAAQHADSGHGEQMLFLTERGAGYMAAHEAGSLTEQ